MPPSRCSRRYHSTARGLTTDRIERTSVDIVLDTPVSFVVAFKSSSTRSNQTWSLKTTYYTLAYTQSPCMCCLYSQPHTTCWLHRQNSNKESPLRMWRQVCNSSARRLMMLTPLHHTETMLEARPDQLLTCSTSSSEHALMRSAE